MRLCAWVHLGSVNIFFCRKGECTVSNDIAYFCRLCILYGIAYIALKVLVLQSHLNEKLGKEEKVAMARGTDLAGFLWLLALEVNHGSDVPNRAAPLCGHSFSILDCERACVREEVGLRGLYDHTWTSVCYVIRPCA